MKGDNVRTKQHLSKLQLLAPKVVTYMTENEGHMTAEKLAKVFRLSIYQIYAIIRIIRIEKQIGVIPTHKGYILSKFASVRDDVHFLRRLNGRRTGDVLSLMAAEDDIRERWHKLPHGNSELKLILGPLIVTSTTVLERAQKVLLSTLKSC